MGHRPADPGQPCLQQLQVLCLPLQAARLAAQRSAALLALQLMREAAHLDSRQIAEAELAAARWELNN